MLSLRVFSGLLLLLIVGGMVALVVVLSQSGTDSVNDVALGLREQISLVVVGEVMNILDLPFSGLQRVRAMIDADAPQMERWDGMYFEELLMHQDIIMQNTPGWGNNLYTTNEYGHDCTSFGEASSTTLVMATSPNLDQREVGMPTWVIPCRYQANCTSAANWRHHQWCVNQSNPWGGGQAPFWAAGQGMFADNDTLAAYRRHAVQPEWATWAVPQNPEGADFTYCRPSATTPKPHCPNSGGCPEFNSTEYHYPKYKRPHQDDMSYSWSLTWWDPRQRWWYLATKQLPPGSKYYADVKICATINAPCFTATQPIHVYVSEVGAWVQGPGGLGVVERYEHTLLEMHTPVVRYDSGVGTVAVRRRQLSLACANATDCAGRGIGSGSVYMQTLVPKFVGVVATDFNADALVEIASSFKVGKTGSVFIGEYGPGAQLLTSGFPCPAQQAGLLCFQRKVVGDADRVAERVSAFDEYAGPIVSGVMKELFAPTLNMTTGMLDATTMEWHTRALIDRSVNFGGDGYWVRFVPLAPLLDNVQNLDWWVCIVIPQDDYLEEIREREVVSLVVLVSAMFLMILLLFVGVVLAFVRPISLLITDFEYACTMNLDPIERRSGGAVSELCRLQASFNVLASNLRMYRPFLPPSCFGMREISEDETEDEVASSLSSSVGVSDGSSQSVSSHDTLKSQAVSQKSRMADGLRKRRITVVSTNVHGFHREPMMHNPATLRAHHADYVVLLLAAGGPRCIAETFSGDRMVFSWNAMGRMPPTAAPYRAALQMAQLRFGGAEVHVGLSCGEALCGIMGPYEMKRFALLGPCYGTSILMMLLNKHYRDFTATRVLLDDKAQQIAESADFDLHIVDAIHLSKMKNKEGRSRLWNLLKQRIVAEEEWMYKLAESTGKDSEWLNFLNGKDVARTTCPRLHKLLSKGVNGLTYVGRCPPIDTLMG